MVRRRSLPPCQSLLISSLCWVPLCSHQPHPSQAPWYLLRQASASPRRCSGPQTSSLAPPLAHCRGGKEADLQPQARGSGWNGA